MATLTIYGTPISTYVRAVRLLLEEAGADYNLEDIGIFNGDNQSSEYLAKNPFGKVPTLGINGEMIYETPAIISYLDETVANNKFTPAEPLHRARMRQIMAIIDNYLYSAVISTIVIQRLIVPSQGGQTDEAQVKEAIAPAQKALAAIESLTVGTPYLLGESLNIADFYLIPIFIYFSQTPEFTTAIAQTPKLQSWWNKVSELPKVKEVCA